MKTKINPIITKNRTAWYDYEILDSLEAGIILQGTEIKSIRNRGISLDNAYATIEDGEVFLVGSYVEPYEHGNVYNHEPTRRRKLLLHKQQIQKWQTQLTPGMTLIPLDAHFSETGKVKILLSLAKGKKKYDKRESLKKKEAEREIRIY